MYSVLFEGTCGRTKGVSFHPSQPVLLVSTHTGAVLAYDLSIGGLVHSMDHDGPVRCVSYNRTGDVFASCGDDTKVRLFKHSTKNLLSSYGHSDYVRQVAFHRTHPLVVSCSDDQTVKIYNILSRKVVGNATGHAHYVMAAAFVGEYVVSGSLDGTLRVWDYAQVLGPQSDRLSSLLSLPKVTVKQIIETHDRGINSVVEIPGGFASASDDRTVRLFQYRGDSFVEVDCFFVHTNNVTALCVFNGRLVSCGEDGLLLIHPNPLSTHVTGNAATSRVGLDMSVLDRSPSEDSTFWSECDGSERSKSTPNSEIKISKDTRFWCLASKGNLLAVGHDTGFTVYDFSRPVILDRLGSGIFYVISNSLRFNDFSTEEVIATNIGSCLGLRAAHPVSNRHYCCYTYIQPSKDYVDTKDTEGIGNNSANISALGNKVGDKATISSNICNGNSQISNFDDHNHTEGIGGYKQHPFEGAVLVQYDGHFVMYHHKKAILKAKGRGCIIPTSVLALKGNFLTIHKQISGNSTDARTFTKSITGMSKDACVSSKHANIKMIESETISLENYYDDIYQFNETEVILINNSLMVKYDVERQMVTGNLRIKNVKRIHVHNNLMAAIQTNEITFVNHKLGVIGSVNEMVGIQDGFFECNQSGNTHQKDEPYAYPLNRNKNQGSIGRNNEQASLSHKNKYNNIVMGSLNIDNCMFLFIYATQKHLMYAYYDGDIHTGVLKSLDKEIVPLIKKTEYLYYFTKNTIENTKVNYSEMDLRLNITLLSKHKSLTRNTKLINNYNYSNERNEATGYHENTNFHSEKDSAENSPYFVNGSTEYESNSVDRKYFIASDLHKKNHGSEANGFVRSELFCSKKIYDACKKQVVNILNSGSVCGQSIRDFIANKNYQHLLKTDDTSDLKMLKMDFNKNKQIINKIISSKTYEELKELSTEALRHCNIDLAEKLLWKTRDYNRLAILYYLTKKFDKLEKLSKYGDDHFKLHMAIVNKKPELIKEILEKHNIQSDIDMDYNYEFFDQIEKLSKDFDQSKENKQTSTAKDSKLAQRCEDGEFIDKISSLNLQGSSQDFSGTYFNKSPNDADADLVHESRNISDHHEPKNSGNSGTNFIDSSDNSKKRIINSSSASEIHLNNSSRTSDSIYTNNDSHSIELSSMNNDQDTLDSLSMNSDRLTLDSFTINNTMNSLESFNSHNTNEFTDQRDLQRNRMSIDPNADQDSIQSASIDGSLTSTTQSSIQSVPHRNSFTNPTQDSINPSSANDKSTFTDKGFIQSSPDNDSLTNTKRDFIRSVSSNKTDLSEFSIADSSEESTTHLFDLNSLNNYSEFIHKNEDLQNLSQEAFNFIQNGKFSKALQLLKTVIYTLTNHKINNKNKQLRQTIGKYLGALICEKYKKKIQDITKILSISYNFKNIAIHHKNLAHTNIMVLLYKNNNYKDAKNIANQIMQNEKDEFDQYSKDIACKILKSKKEITKYELNFENRFCCDTLSFESISKQCTWCFNHFKDEKHCTICGIGYLQTDH